MGQFLDPIANAKTLGFLYILIGMVNVFSGISSAYALVIGAIQIIVGFSLRQSRIWALYLLALNIIIRIVVIIIDQSNGFSVGIGATASILVDLIILLWFFQARDRMKK